MEPSGARAQKSQNTRSEEWERGDEIMLMQAIFSNISKKTGGVNNAVDWGEVAKTQLSKAFTVEHMKNKLGNLRKSFNSKYRDTDIEWTNEEAMYTWLIHRKRQQCTARVGGTPDPEFLTQQ